MIHDAATFALLFSLPNVEQLSILVMNTSEDADEQPATMQPVYDALAKNTVLQTLTICEGEEICTDFNMFSFTICCYQKFDLFLTIFLTKILNRLQELQRRWNAQDCVLVWYKHWPSIKP